jgi:hypothetical protein
MLSAMLELKLDKGKPRQPLDVIQDISQRANRSFPRVSGIVGDRMYVKYGSLSSARIGDVNMMEC